MLLQDGSPHEWLAGQAPLDMIVTLDDATSATYSIFSDRRGKRSFINGRASATARMAALSSHHGG
jgi:hypothetical protein